MVTDDENYGDILAVGASVIVCCYNSAARLPRTLAHLAGQVVPEDFFWEIILVNNASTDNTVECATEIWNKLHPKNVDFKIINESETGLIHARKRGVNEAKSECIIFCDDDNWLDKSYVFISHMVIEKNKIIGAAGGQNLPVTDADSYPEWFEEYKDKYGLGIPAITSGDVSYRTFILGAGLVTRKSLFLQIFDDKYPSLLKGRNGKQLSSGDDFEYCKRLLLWGYKLYYDENMKLEHFIPKERLTIAYRQGLMEGITGAGKVLNEYDLAIRMHKRNKNKNKWRLLILSPFRILFAQLGWSKRVLTDERLTFFYLAPFHFGADPVKGLIKKFMHHK